MTLKHTNAKLLIHTEMFSDGEKSEIDTVCDAQYEKRDNVVQLTYLEPRMDEPEECLTNVEIDEEGVWIRRSGEIEASMRYEPGKLHKFVYNFDFGMLTLEAYTYEYECQLDDTGGFVHLNYMLDYGTQKAKVDLTIKIKEVNNGIDYH